MDNSNENRQPDELFKSKLEGHDSPVSGELWDRLSKQQRLSKVKPAWYNRRILAAAIVSGIAVAGGIWLSMPSERETLSASASGEIPGIPQQVAREAGSSAGEDSILPEYAEAAVPARGTFSDEEKSDSGKKAPEAGDPETHKQVTVQPEPVAFAGKVASRVDESGEIAVSQASVSKGENENKQPETRVLIVYVRPPAQVEEVQDKTSEELVAATEVVKSEVVEERKKLSFKRFFKQLKNAKTGEKIDWEELGITPQRVFANVDHSGTAPAGEQ